MVLSSYLSFSSLYEIEQRSMLSSSTPVSRCSSIESNASSIYAPTPKRAQHRVHFMPNMPPALTTRSSSVSSGCSSSSTSSDSSYTGDSSDSDASLSLSPSSRLAAAAAAGRPTRPATPSVYTNHSQSLHRNSKRYSTEDGTLPHFSFGTPAWLKGRRSTQRSRSSQSTSTDEEEDAEADELELVRTRNNLERAAEGQDLSLKRYGHR